MIGIDLSGKVALITGSSRGMGRATALLLAAAGADVVLTYHQHRDAGEAVFARVRELGRDALLLACDVAKTDEIEAAVARAQERFGHIDILVSNAGTGTPHLLTATSDAEYTRVFDVNVKAFLAAARAVAPGMKERRWGRIIAIGSATGQTGRSYLSSSPRCTRRRRRHSSA
jgi:3-oxoacyl-[acyl-carrier protein] reductase